MIPICPPLLRNLLLLSGLSKTHLRMLSLPGNGSFCYSADSLAKMSLFGRRLLDLHIHNSHVHRSWNLNPERSPWRKKLGLLFFNSPTMLMLVHNLGPWEALLTLICAMLCRLRPVLLDTYHNRLQSVFRRIANS